MNKEGLVSCLGYCGLYLWGAALAHLLHTSVQGALGPARQLLQLLQLEAAAPAPGTPGIAVASMGQAVAAAGGAAAGGGVWGGREQRGGGGGAGHGPAATAATAGHALAPLHLWLFKWLLLDGLLWCAALGAEALLEPISRRSCNLPYILWTVALCLAMCLLLAAAQLLVPGCQPRLMQAVSRNQLPLFLAANLLTGAVNFSVDTMGVGAWAAWGVVASYTGLVCGMAAGLEWRGVTLKF